QDADVGPRRDAGPLHGRRLPRHRRDQGVRSRDRQAEHPVRRALAIPGLARELHAGGGAGGARRRAGPRHAPLPAGGPAHPDVLPRREVPPARRVRADLARHPHARGGVAEGRHAARRDGARRAVRAAHEGRRRAARGRGRRRPRPPSPAGPRLRDAGGARGVPHRVRAAARGRPRSARRDDALRRVDGVPREDAARLLRRARSARLRAMRQLPLAAPRRRGGDVAGGLIEDTSECAAERRDHALDRFALGRLRLAVVVLEEDLAVALDLQVDGDRTAAALALVDLLEPPDVAAHDERRGVRAARLSVEVVADRRRHHAPRVGGPPVVDVVVDPVRARSVRDPLGRERLVRREAVHLDRPRERGLGRPGDAQHVVLDRRRRLPGEGAAREDRAQDERRGAAAHRSSSRGWTGRPRISREGSAWITSSVSWSARIVLVSSSSAPSRARPVLPTPVFALATSVRAAFAVASMSFRASSSEVARDFPWPWKSMTILVARSASSFTRWTSVANSSLVCFTCTVSNARLSELAMLAKLSRNVFSFTLFSCVKTFSWRFFRMSLTRSAISLNRSRNSSSDGASPGIVPPEGSGTACAVPHWNSMNLIPVTSDPTRAAVVSVRTGVRGSRSTMTATFGGMSPVSVMSRTRPT